MGLGEEEGDRLLEALQAAVDRLATEIKAPGSGRIVDAADLAIAAHGRQAYFTATIVEDLGAAPKTRIAGIDLASAAVQFVSPGNAQARLPLPSPVGERLACLIDTDGDGDVQLHWLELASAEARLATRVEGWVEYARWSPCGERLLLGVADHGVDLAGGQGGLTTARTRGDQPDWAPRIVGAMRPPGRHVWIFDSVDDTVRRVPARETLWEADWHGDRLVAIMSNEGDEAGWYDAVLAEVDITSGEARPLYRPAHQLGWVAGAPDGSAAACVEALCSDRGIVAGDLIIVDDKGVVDQPDLGFDISHVLWLDSDRLLLAGHRGLETVLKRYDRRSGCAEELWSSDRITTAGRYAQVAACGESGDFLVIGEGFGIPPEIARISERRYAPIATLAPLPAFAGRIAMIPRMWHAADGLEIEGWLLHPQGAGPWPTIVDVHGGPVLHWRSRWLGRGGLCELLLLERGYAIFLPNPRGSSGRGQAFAAHVVGDMGGADLADILAGIDALVADQLADPDRLGIMGVSYGGYLSATAVTQTDRFKAAVPISPITNFVTQRLLSNIPAFVDRFLDGRFDVADGDYYRRSPLFHAARVTTPTLCVAGALDRCTPPAEAEQFHAAISERGVASQLLLYPLEGHGVRGPQAAPDCAARVAAWFDDYLRPEGHP